MKRKFMNDVDKKGDCQGYIASSSHKEEEESDSFDECEKVNCESGKRRRANWKEDHITDMVNIIVNDDKACQETDIL